MSNPNLNLPEPTLPEHLLIRDAAPEPTLSSGLKSRVMADCNISIRRARRAKQWKAAGTVAAVCCLSLLAAVNLPTAEETPTTTEQKTVPEYVSPGSKQYRSNGSMAVDQARPKDTDSGDPAKIIEDLRGRTLDANMLF